MASKIPGGGGKVKLNSKGMGELLKSQGIRAELTNRMARVAAALPGSSMEVRDTGSRLAVRVSRGSDFDEANTGDLSRALDLAGGERGRLTQDQISSRRDKRRAKRGR
jgi:hypothetical protein